MDIQWEKRSIIQGFKGVLSVGLLAAAVGGSGFAVAEGVAGGDDFKHYCASCHRVSGRGDGPVAASLNNSPAALTILATPSSRAVLHTHASHLG